MASLNTYTLTYYDHLLLVCAATTIFLCAQNNSRNPAAVESLRNLETTAYYVDDFFSDRPGRVMYVFIQLSWDGQTIVLRCAICSAVSIFWHNFLLGCLCFRCLFDGKSVSFGKQIYPMHIKTVRTHSGKDDYYYYTWTGPQALALCRLLLECVPLRDFKLLVWISVDVRILCSFTNFEFITTLGLSGPLYRPG